MENTIQSECWAGVWIAYSTEILNFFMKWIQKEIFISMVRSKLKPCLRKRCPVDKPHRRTKYSDLIFASDLTLKWLEASDQKKWVLKKLVRLYFRLKRWWTALDYSKIEDLEFGGIRHWDAPKYCDAFIERATYKGRDMTDAELDRLNEDSDYVHEKVQDYLY